ncbi:hypothetical protein Slin15195_G064480 [Septoria linicola]|uniref:Uncharacterized protein n=1 Tax=Septoria linicola TaxID=215465 RepID=A0A9Q9EKC9_9PEZI|nr:hypothetical protein Slin15195_G064480 [Septoria linicola]
MKRERQSPHVLREVHRTGTDYGGWSSNIAVLSVLNNKPSRDWQISGVSITPNALMAIITTFSKSALLLPVAECIAQMKWPYFQQQAHLAWHLQVFDDASRGPLRSMKLLWRLNIHTMMASLAAVITILALAVEPFTQQVITYEGLDTKASNLSSSIITNSIFARDGSNEEHKINLQLERALLSGLLSEVDDVRNTCPTSTCTWPAYKTLGVCRKCQDIGARARISCEDIAIPVDNQPLPHVNTR